MARNKYPEETVNLILDTAARLFIQKGYEKTSIQDIVNELGGLSKGAIYHHFKSKEDIFTAAADRIMNNDLAKLVAIRDDDTLNGLEKLKKMLELSLNDPDQIDILQVYPYLVDSPKQLALQFKELINEVVPDFMEPIIRQGVADGSIQTEYPDELAELVVFLPNIWINPIVYPMSAEKIERKIKLYITAMKSLGVDLTDVVIDPLLARIKKLAK